MASDLSAQSTSHLPNEGPGGCVPWERFERMREHARWWRYVALAGWMLWIVAMVGSLT